MKAELTAIIEPPPEGGYWAICPEVPGANGQGETVEETKRNLIEAIELIFEDRRSELTPGKLGRRRVDGSGCVRCLVKAVQGKEVGRDATEGGVRAEVVIVVRAPVFDEESGFGQGANQCWLRQSSRKVPLKLSMKAFCIGLLGWI